MTMCAFRGTRKECVVFMKCAYFIVNVIHGEIALIVKNDKYRLPLYAIEDDESKTEFFKKFPKERFAAITYITNLSDLFPKFDRVYMAVVKKNMIIFEKKDYYYIPEIYNQLDDIASIGISSFENTLQKEERVIFSILKKGEISIYSQNQMSEVITRAFCSYFQKDKNQKPDIVMFDNESDTIIGIEAFDFDATERYIKKGKDKGTTGFVEKHKENKFHDENKKEGIIVNYTYSQNCSFENYENNLKLCFENHVRSTKDYLSTLQGFNAKNKLLGFLINDVTALGVYDDKTPILVHQTEMFWELFFKSEYDFCITYSSQHEVAFIIQRADYYTIKKDKIINTDNVNFFSFSNPISMSLTFDFKSDKVN